MKVDLVFNTQGFFQLLKEFIADNIGDYISIKDEEPSYIFHGPVAEEATMDIPANNHSARFSMDDVCHAFGVPPCEAFYSYSGITTREKAQTIARQFVAGIGSHNIKRNSADDKFLDRMRGHYRDAWNHRIPMKEAERRIAVERHHKDGGNVEFVILDATFPYWAHAKRPLWRWDSFDYRIAEHCYCGDSLHFSLNHEPMRCVRCNLPRRK